MLRFPLPFERSKTSPAKICHLSLFSANYDRNSAAKNEAATVLYIYIYIYIKVKVKVTLEQTTKAQRWSRGIALFFL